MPKPWSEHKQETNECWARCITTAARNASDTPALTLATVINSAEIFRLFEQKLFCLRGLT